MEVKKFCTYCGKRLEVFSTRTKVEYDFDTGKKTIKTYAVLVCPDATNDTISDYNTAHTAFVDFLIDSETEE